MINKRCEIPMSHSSHNGPMWFLVQESFPVKLPPKQLTGALMQYKILLEN